MARKSKATELAKRPNIASQFSHLELEIHFNKCSILALLFHCFPFYCKASDDVQFVSVPGWRPRTRVWECLFWLGDVQKDNSSAGHCLEQVYGREGIVRRRQDAARPNGFCWRVVRTMFSASKGCQSR